MKRSNDESNQCQHESHQESSKRVRREKDNSTSQTIPIMTENIERNPSSFDINMGRNYKYDPLPFVDDRTLYWELKRPEIENLPPIPAFDDCNNTAVNAAKSFCIQQLASSVPSNEATSSFCQWFSAQHAREVIDCYNTIRVKLPKANQWIVEHNSLLMNVTGANICTTPLGSLVQAKSALFYIAKYIVKPNVPLGKCLNTLNASMEHVEQYPSQASDSGTDKCTVQHYITRTLNSLATQSEIADTQATATLLGLKANVCTHSFVYYSPQDAINYIKALGQQKLDNHYQPPIKCPTEVFRGASHSPLYTVSTNPADPKIPIPYAAHYHYRGEELRNLSRFEYYTLIEIRRMNDTDTDESGAPHGSRNKSTRYRFDPSYDIHSTYIEQLSSKQPIPILIGPPPYHPPPPPSASCTTDEQNQWQSKADEFAMYYLTTFRPEPDAYSGNLTSLSYSWDDFCEWIKTLEHSPRFIDKFRATALMNRIYGLYSKEFHRQLIFAYRSKDCTPWTEAERCAAEQYFATYGSKRSTNSDFESATNAAFVDCTPLSPQMVTFANNEHSFCSMQSEAPDNIFQDFESTQQQQREQQQEKEAPALHSHQETPPSNVVYCASVANVQNTFERITAYRDEFNEVNSNVFANTMSSSSAQRASSAKNGPDEIETALTWRSSTNPCSF